MLLLNPAAITGQISFMKPHRLFLIAGLFMLSMPVWTQVADSSGINSYNFISFSENNRIIDQELLELTDPAYYAHPEFGSVPFNTICKDCIELIDRRTSNSRYYVKKGTRGSNFFVQTSSSDLHYKNSENEWLTIDPRLKPDSVSNTYSAKQQMYPTGLDFNYPFTSIRTEGGFDLRFNHDLRLASEHNGLTGEGVEHAFSAHTVGDDGCMISNAWNGIDIKERFTEGSVETDYILNSLNAIDTSSDYTIFEDRISLPAGYSIRPDEYEGSAVDNNLWNGDLIVTDVFDREIARIYSPVVFDNNPLISDSVYHEHPAVYGYRIEKENNVFNVKLYVKTEWLLSSERIFPIVVDPLVSVSSSWAGVIGSNLTPSTCDVTFNVTLPANATFTDCKFAWELANGNCGSGVCLVSDARIKVSTSCSDSPAAAAFYWACPSPVCDYHGGWLPPATSDPVLVTCFTPSCSQYTVPFTFKLLRVRNCGATTGCPNNCVKILSYTVSVEGHTVESTMLTDGANLSSYTITDCAHQYATLDAGGVYGVPSYTYVWSPTGGTGSTEFVTPSMGSTTVYTVTITDACGNVVTDNVTINNPCATLPLELISFSGYNKNTVNYLNWSTASEKDTKLFEIERSTEGKGFEKIGEVNASGISSVNVDYNFTDEGVASDINYYRLKQIDLDNSFTYSDIIALSSVDIPAATLDIEAGSNASMFTISSPAEGEASIFIYDIAGQQMMKQTLLLGAGANTSLINCSLLPAGAYLAVVQMQNETAQTKFIVN